VTESGNINTVAVRDIKDALTGFKTKFIPIDYDNVLIGHIGTALLFGENWGRYLFTRNPLFCQRGLWNLVAGIWRLATRFWHTVPSTGSGPEHVEGSASQAKFKTVPYHLSILFSPLNFTESH